MLGLRLYVCNSAIEVVSAFSGSECLVVVSV